MAQTTRSDRPGRGGRKAPLIVMALLLLVVIAGFSSGMGPGLGMVGMIALGAGGWALVRGRAGWFHVATRRAGLVVSVAGLAAFIVGMAVTPTPAPANVVSATGSVAATTSSAAPTISTSPSSSAAPRPSAQPAAIVAAPATTALPTTAAPPTTSASATTSAPPPPPAPVMELACPSGGSNASPVFSQSISATAPYKVAIKYGDGDSYSNDDQHLAAIFTHTYKVSGNFVVDATVTDATGQTASASCSYNWVKPAPAPKTTSQDRSSVLSGGGATSATVGGSTSGDTYTNVDGDQVRVPVQAPEAPAGATAKCRDGSWSSSQHRSGTCSHHGGVDEWL
jgi:hypothetical protein